MKRRSLIRAVVMIGGIAVATVLGYVVYRSTPFGRYQATINAGREQNSFIIEMERLWPHTQHFISYSTGTYGPPTWNSEVGIAGRYLLTMQMPIKLQGLFASAEFGSPVFYLMEIESTETLPDGRLFTRAGSEQKTFGAEEWRRLYESGGDLSSIGIVGNPARIRGTED